jgi:hypothetical protein
LAGRDRIDEIGGLGRFGPNHLAPRLAVHLLPLRQHHFVRFLQTVISGIGGELDVTEEGGHVG